MKWCTVVGRRAAQWFVVAGVAACGPAVKTGDDVGETSGGGGGSSSDDSNGSSEAGPTTTTVSASGPLDEATTDTPVVNDISGDHLFALSAIIDPAHPFQLRAMVVQEGNDVRMSLQPLSLDPQATTFPREPVGDPIQANTVIADDGTFEIDLGEVLLVGQSNPITGSDIVATLRFSGRVESPDYWCGDVTGTVTAPLNLDLTGSTFAGTRIFGELPVDPIIASCGR